LELITRRYERASTMSMSNRRSMVGGNCADAKRHGTTGTNAGSDDQQREKTDRYGYVDFSAIALGSTAMDPETSVPADAFSLYELDVHYGSYEKPRILRQQPTKWPSPLIIAFVGAWRAGC
jgi:hypothetical protein